MCQIWEDEDKREKYRNVYKRLIDFNKNEKNKKKTTTHMNVYIQTVKVTGKKKQKTK